MSKIDTATEIVNNHRTEEVVAWAMLELGKARFELNKKPDSLIAMGKYIADVDTVYKVLQELSQKLTPDYKVVA